MEKKFVYMFSEGNASMREELGGKGANLAEMTKLGLPVPQGFTISCGACNQFYEDGEKINAEIESQIDKAMKKLEKLSGKKFGDVKNPFLVSVRSGARASMPGMMDTILNLGLNDETVVGLAKQTGNERFAFDSYRRFIQMLSDVVFGLSKKKFEEIIDEVKKEKGVKTDTELSASDLKELTFKFKAFFKKETKKDFPQDPRTQLIEAVKAVFKSWNNPRATLYRRMNDIPSSWGTAVNVQAMVFGNMGQTSGTGVAFTRNPSTGEKKLYGEYLMNAQGEDVVAGVRTPQKIETLKKQNPAIYQQFVQICSILENHYRDMQDMEFTIENGKLFMLQTRNGKRTANAAIKIAVDLVKEKMISEEEALLKIDPKQLDTLLHPTFDPKVLKTTKADATGLPASPGAGCGAVVFSAEKAKQQRASGKKVVLVRLETSPEDIEGMVASEGILTARGGMTSHAAVVARGMGKCCVAGCGDLRFDGDKCFLNNVRVKEGDIISIDGSTGKIYLAEIKTVPTSAKGDLKTIMDWAKKHKTLQVRVNADTPKDAAQAVKFGAEGVGLCRTEHMFFEADRILAVREMIVAKTLAERERALAKIEPMQKEDFKGIYKAMDGRPVTIRFLDPPLHEFVPHSESEIKKLAKVLKVPFASLKSTIDSLHEFNPMLGHRGCRLAITFPEIAKMQTRAVISAALEVQKSSGKKIVPEIMIPLVCDVAEFKFVKKVVCDVADELIKKSKTKMQYKVGTMIEVPRAALLADEIAKDAEFFSFGTNDLTQMTYGFSRDDAEKFLNCYYENKVFEQDPFVRIDEKGVGKLVKMAVDLGKSTRPDIKLGICGEQGGDPATIEFCHNAGLSYVSCSPFRIMIAYLAAAQANIKNKNNKK